MVHKFAESLVGSLYLTERRNTSTRPASGAEIDDIFGIFELLDSNSLLSNFSCVPHDLTRIPRYGPEDINTFSISENQVVLEAAVESVRSRIDGLESSHGSAECASNPLQSGLDDLSSAVHLRLDAVCSGIDKLSQLYSTSTSLSASTLPLSCDDVLSATQSRLDCLDSAVNARLDAICTNISNLPQLHSTAVSSISTPEVDAIYNKLDGISSLVNSRWSDVSSRMEKLSKLQSQSTSSASTVVPEKIQSYQQYQQRQQHHFQQQQQQQPQHVSYVTPV